MRCNTDNCINKFKCIALRLFVCTLPFNMNVRVHTLQILTLNEPIIHALEFVCMSLSFNACACVTRLPYGIGRANMNCLSNDISESLASFYQVASINMIEAANSKRILYATKMDKKGSRSIYSQFALSHHNSQILHTIKIFHFAIMPSFCKWIGRPQVIFIILN